MNRSFVILAVATLATGCAVAATSGGSRCCDGGCLDAGRSRFCGRYPRARDRRLDVLRCLTQSAFNTAATW